MACPKLRHFPRSQQTQTAHLFPHVVNPDNFFSALATMFLLKGRFVLFSVFWRLIISDDISVTPVTFLWQPSTGAAHPQGKDNKAHKHWVLTTTGLQKLANQKKVGF